MKKALISPNETCLYTVSWNTSTKPYTEIKERIGQRIAQVADTEFPVAATLFWVDCSDTITAEEYYYDADTSSIIALPNAPLPMLDDTEPEGTE
jgi:hypothetical protein